MVYFDQLLRAVVPDGFVLELLLSLAIQACWLTPAAIVMALLLCRSSASARHLAWQLLLAVMVVGPVLSIIVPGDVQFSILEEAPDGGHGELSVRAEALSQQSLVAKPNVQRLQQLELSEQSPVQSPDQGLDASERASKWPKAAVFEAALSADIPPRSSTLPAVRKTEMILAGIWAAGILLLSLRVIGGQLSMWRMLGAATSISDERILAVASEVISACGESRKVRWLEHAQSSMPMTCGVWAPAIIIPVAAKEWSSDRLRMVLLHELAHVQRRDCLWQWLTHVVTVGQWFNPLAWLATSRLRSEREKACDDVVLNTGVRASDYAETLLDLSTGGRRNVFDLCAGLAMARPQRLASRVESIVDDRRNRGVVSRRARIIAALCTCLLMIPLGLMAQADVTQRQRIASDADVDPPKRQPAQQQQVEQASQKKASQQRERQLLPSVTLPGGQMLQRSDDHRPLVDAAIRLLRSASVEVPYRGQRGTSVTLLFHPSLEIDLSHVSPRNAAGPTGRIGRMYVDVGTQPGPDTIATEIDGKYRSFTKHHLREWVAFRSEYDRLDFGRPRPIVPSVGDWSKPVNGLQARLAVENWRDPIVGIYLELRNVKDLGNTMTVPADAERIDFELRDADGKKISPAGLPRSGPVVELKDFQLPFDSSLRFNLSVTTVGVPNVKAMIALRSHAWTLDEAPGSYRLSASFKVEKPEKFSHTLWYGVVHVPPVKIQPASRERKPDTIVSRTYKFSNRTRDTQLNVLKSWFEEEDDVRFQAGASPHEIDVSAHVSRQRYIVEVVQYLKFGSTPSS
jgi:beta-lactamase regulating signal transducer with metallopeptidase domain